MLYVNNILTLLFVCDTGEFCSPFLAPLRAAPVRLLVGCHLEDAKTLLASDPLDAIVFDPDHLQDSHSVLAELKRAAPRTPVILLRGKNHHSGIKPPGVAAVCRADPADEAVLSTIPAFLAFILGKQSGIVRGANGEPLRAAPSDRSLHCVKPNFRAGDAAAAVVTEMRDPEELDEEDVTGRRKLG